jgi:hypothetical protein
VSTLRIAVVVGILHRLAGLPEGPPTGCCDDVEPGGAIGRSRPPARLSEEAANSSEMARWEPNHPGWAEWNAQHSLLSSGAARLKPVRAPPMKASVGTAKMCQRGFQSAIPPNRCSAARTSSGR